MMGMEDWLCTIEECNWHTVSHGKFIMGQFQMDLMSFTIVISLPVSILLIFILALRKTTFET